jgi:hypothetical protein
MALGNLKVYVVEPPRNVSARFIRRKMRGRLFGLWQQCRAQVLVILFELLRAVAFFRTGRTRKEMPVNRQKVCRGESSLPVLSQQWE